MPGVVAWELAHRLLSRRGKKRLDKDSEPEISRKLKAIPRHEKLEEWKLEVREVFENRRPFP